MALEAVRRLNEMRREKSVPYHVVARGAGIAESTLRRWRTRARRQMAVLTVPGPKKTVPVDMGALMNGMDGLHHRRCRSYGAPALWLAHREGISRRDFYGLLARYRARLKEQERAGWWRYRWLKVGAVWSMDDMDFCFDEDGQMLRVHNVMDLGSRHLFEPLEGESLPGERVAAHLEGLFHEHGAPPFIKSDGGSNLLKCKPVSELISQWCVIPVISPPRYPQYNGVMERVQSDTRTAVMDLLPEDAFCDTQHFRGYAVAGAHRCNHIRRDVLGHQHACHVFSTRNGEMKTVIHERRAIYEWLKQKQESILSSEVKDPDDKWAANAAWRSAAEEWLLQNKVIEIVPGTEEVSTNFEMMSAHN
jgi:hypothetical protein